ncbi:MAG: CehA/McbA family metallohydrolase [Armatimonadota bacterium]
MPDKRKPIIPSIQKGIRHRWQPIEDGTREWWRGYREWLRADPAPGQATIEPDTVEAGSRLRLKLVFTVGEGGIAPYGHIAIEPPLPELNPYTESAPRPSSRFAVTCSNPRPELAVDVSDGIIDIMNREYPLEEGDEVTIIFGEPESNPASMPSQMRRHPFPVAVAVENTPEYRLIENIPELTVEGAPARQFLVVPKPAITSGEPFSVQIVALDDVGSNPDTKYTGTVQLTCTDEKAELPESVQFTEKDAGVRVVEGLRLSSSGVHYLTACDMQRGIAGRSSPVTADDFFEGSGVFFGDIHCHTWHCDGHATPDEAYYWSRQARAMDFGALTNHVEGAKRYHVEDFWKFVQCAAKKHHFPGEYVTFLAFEWGGWDVFGDKCVYYLDDDQPCWGANDPESNTPQKLWEVLPEGRAISIIHHPKFGGRTNWEYHDPHFQPLVEIYSNWGFSEIGGPWCVRQALDRGYRIGFIASSDDHQGQMGNFDKGVAAVIAPELTRPALFDSLASRHCYATTGRQILLNMTVNGHGMGQEFEQEASAKRKISIRAAGTDEIVKVTLIKSGEELKSWEPAELTFEETLVDDTPVDESEYYYVRLQQRDDSYAWSSPIWVDAQ